MFFQALGTPWPRGEGAIGSNNDTRGLIELKVNFHLDLSLRNETGCLLT